MGKNYNGLQARKVAVSILKYGNIFEGIGAALSKTLDGIKRLLHDERTSWNLEQRWREKDGVIYFTVTSNGLSADEWIERLEGRGYRLSDYAKQLLRSDKFNPTNGVRYEVAVLKGELFGSNERVTKNIRKHGKYRGFLTANPELACLIREAYSDRDLKAMGLEWIVCQHESIKDAEGDPDLLDVGRGLGGNWLSASYNGPSARWGRRFGFAFVVPTVVEGFARPTVVEG